MKYLFLAVSALAAVLLLLCTDAYSHADDPHAEWLMSLKQPDKPELSCCGVADRYYIDWYHEVTNGYEAEVPLFQDGMKVNKKVFIPMNKVIWDKNNPTGKAVLFISYNNIVLCFVMANGV